MMQMLLLIAFGEIKKIDMKILIVVSMLVFTLSGCSKIMFSIFPLAYGMEYSGKELCEMKLLPKNHEECKKYE